MRATTPLCHFAFSCSALRHKPRQRHPSPAPVRCLALPQMWWTDAGYRKAYSCRDPTPFSANPGRRRRMRRLPTSQNLCVLPLANSLCVFLSDQSLFPTPQGHPHRTTLELSATEGSRSIESAQPHCARVHTLPTRPSDTALRLTRSYATGSGCGSGATRVPQKTNLMTTK